MTTTLPAAHVPRGARLHVSAASYTIIRVTPTPQGVVLRTACRTSLAFHTDHPVTVTLPAPS